MKDDCPFCGLGDILSEDKPGKPTVVYRETQGCVIIPLGPVTPGHVLVVPYTHVENFAENINVSSETIAIAGRYVKRVGGDFNLITSKGRAATQTVKHLHLHLVPRRIGDEMSLPWDIRINPQEVAKIIDLPRFADDTSEDIAHDIIDHVRGKQH